MALCRKITLAGPVRGSTLTVSSSEVRSPSSSLPLPLSSELYWPPSEAYSRASKNASEMHEEL